MKVPILVYYSTNIAGNDYRDNDHVAFASDLEQKILDEAKRRIVSKKRELA